MKKNTIIHKLDHLGDFIVKLYFSDGFQTKINFCKWATHKELFNMEFNEEEIEKFKGLRIKDSGVAIIWPQTYGYDHSPSIAAKHLYVWGKYFKTQIPYDDSIMYYLEAFEEGVRVTSHTLRELKNAGDICKEFIPYFKTIENKKYHFLWEVLGTVYPKGSTLRKKCREILERSIERINNFDDMDFIYAHSCTLPSNVYYEPIFILFKKDGELFEIQDEIIDSCDPAVSGCFPEFKATTHEKILIDIKNNKLGRYDNEDFFSSHLKSVIENDIKNFRSDIE